MILFKKHHIFRKLFPLLSSLLVHSFIFFILSHFFTLPKTSPQKHNIVVKQYPVHTQIVEQKRFNKIIPKKTAFLSKKNQSIDKNTQAMLKGLFYENKIQTKHSIKNKPFLKTKNPSNKENSRTISSVNKTITKPIKINISDTINFTAPQNTRPNRTMNLLKGVEIGSNTLLNTKEFIYFSYFSRLKEQLYWRWIQYLKDNPEIFPPHSTSQQKTFLTNVYVHLSPEGEIQTIKVINSSGFQKIDYAALHAFFASEPFPNSPSGLVEKDGFIHIKQAFYININSSSIDLFSKHQ